MVLLGRIELPFHPYQGRVLPLYYSSVVGTSTQSRTETFPMSRDRANRYTMEAFYYFAWCAITPKRPDPVHRRFKVPVDFLMLSQSRLTL